MPGLAARPARVVYLLLAGCPFEGLGCCQVWRLAAGPGPLPVAAPASPAMAQARRPLRRGSYPSLRLLALVAYGARTVIDAGFRAEIAIATSAGRDAATVPGADPDRASFTIALNTARDQLVLRRPTRRRQAGLARCCAQYRRTPARQYPLCAIPVAACSRGAHPAIATTGSIEGPCLSGPTRRARQPIAGERQLPAATQPPARGEGLGDVDRDHLGACSDGACAGWCPTAP